MLEKLQNFFAEKILNTYGKSLLRKLIMAAAGFILAKAPILAPIAEALTQNIDHFTSAIIAAILSALAMASSYEDKKKDSEEKEDLAKKAEAAKKAAAKKTTAKKTSTVKKKK